jgi:general secretion pathway protein J
MTRCGPPRRKAAGFTLVEVLVALLLMAILSTFAWFGLDGVLRARDASREAVDRTARMATVLTQWEQDLQAVHDTQVVPALTFDGQTLRLTRRVDGGVALVAWSVRGGLWQRWAGPPQQRTVALQQAWLASQQFLGTEPGQLKVADGASEWQIYFHRGSDWSNAQSTGNVVATPAGGTPSNPPAGATGGTGAVGGPREELPNAVRLVIALQGQKLTRDIALGPSGQ